MWGKLYPREVAVRCSLALGMILLIEDLMSSIKLFTATKDIFNFAGCEGFNFWIVRHFLMNIIMHIFYGEKNV